MLSTSRRGESNAAAACRQPLPVHGRLRAAGVDRFRHAREGSTPGTDQDRRDDVRRLPRSGAGGRMADVSVPALTDRAMSPENLLVERDGAVAIVTINRPKVLNALNAPTLDELRRLILDLKQDETVHAVVVTGAGEKAFVAGADINELAVMTAAGARDHALRGQHVLDLIEHMGKPVIAAINGFALGGGC